jgi:uncharacterized membrane protein
MTALILAVFGGVVGSVLFRDLAGFVPGAAVGALAGWVADLAGRVGKLEKALEANKAAARAAAAPMQPPVHQPPPPATGTPPAAAAARVPPATASAAPRAASSAARARPQTPRARFEPSPLDMLFTNVLRWFTTGNVPVKVGVVLSLFGVGFLVKEGIDREWLVLPIEWRLTLVAAFGAGLLALGWRLRERQPTYAWSVQGGGIGVLYVTIYASFAIYGLLPAAVAFGLLVAVTAAAGALAVLQDARALAVLGILGGFLAPVLASTGAGNHVALFSYYAVLDFAILGIAWFKAWRALNVLGFASTFGIGTLWGIDAYEPALFASTEPFLVLFTLLYLAIPVLFALRVEPKLRGFVDGTLVFGTPLVAFGLQSELVAGTEFGLALSAVALALVYFGMAAYLHRTQREPLRVLVEAQLALGVAFVTIAVPLALDARWTSAAWALQGAALVWLACRQRRPLALFAGLALQVLSGAAYLGQSSVAPAWPVVNGQYLGALVLALAGFFAARLLDPEREQHAPAPPVSDAIAKQLAIALLIWAAAWWFAGAFDEIDRALVDGELAALLGFAAATSVLTLLLASRIKWPRLDWLGLGLWPVAVLLAFISLTDFAHPAAEFGWLAWPAAFGSMLKFLREREARFPRLAGGAHATGYWLAIGLVLAEAHWLVERATAGVWPEVAVLALGAAAVLATLRASAAVAWPFAAQARSYVQAGCGAVVAALVLTAVVLNVASPGDAPPLPYVPLVNPLELASALVLVALLKFLAVLGRQSPALAVVVAARPAVAAVAAWALVTAAVARSVHHFAGVAYDVESLATSTAFQSALSIVWGIAGLAAMVAGARAARRGVWLAGAGLMGVVVVKLFLVDLGNTDTLARVVSFLGVGLLLLAVGYFAPVPPRTAAALRPA